jgi:hypothetical protein
MWKSCGRSVEGLWIARAKRSFFDAITEKTPLLHSVDAASSVLSLEPSGSPARIRGRCPPRQHCFTGLNNVHRFEEVINGREYRIEVSRVGLGQWRAQIARTPGGSAALMPFYGKTPDEAAQQLSRWLALAHGQPQPRV